jgi:tryptophan-rich sensory protein
VAKTQAITWRRDIGLAALPLIAVVATSALAQFATFPNLAPWFAGLIKPGFNPPNWLFGPVWTTLYALMAFAAWRILRLSPSPARRNALILFWTQLALNAAWSWLFFAAHSPLLGLVDIVPQLLLIIATMVAFGRLDKIAGWCLTPLAAWVAYASALNAAIWWLNS